MQTEPLFGDELDTPVDNGLIVQDLSLCRGCKSCMVCPSHLYTVNNQGQCIRSDPKHICMGLGMCVDLCPTGSLQFTSRPTEATSCQNCLRFNDDLE